MTTKLLLAGAFIALLILPAGAQQAPQGAPTRIRGTVEKLDGPVSLPSAARCPVSGSPRIIPHRFSRSIYSSC